MNKDPSPGTRFKPGNPGRSRKAASVPQEPPPAAGQPDPPLDAETLHGRVLRTLSEVLADLDAETTHRLMAARLLEMIRVHNVKIERSDDYAVDAIVESLSDAEMTPVEQVDEPMDHSRVDRPECVALAVPPATPPCAPVMTVEPEPTAGPEVEPVHQVEPAGEPFPCFAFGDLEIFPGLGV